MPTDGERANDRAILVPPRASLPGVLVSPNDAPSADAHTSGGSRPAIVPAHERYRSAAPCNALSVDVEDYFHVLAFADIVDPASWAGRECRIPRNVERLLEIFRAAGVRSTFFTLGWVAERYPEVIRSIVRAGHELASHGYEHRLAFAQSRAEFREDVGRTKKLLEDVSGAEVIGFRAASFSIDERNLWAFDVLQECGYLYSSSVNPIHHDNYGMLDAPRFAFRIGAGGFLELPMTTVRIGSTNLPAAGGGFFRLAPYAAFRWAVRRVNAEQQPAIFYLHPWEIDPAQPRMQGARLRSRFRHYLNLSRMEARLVQLLHDFSWDSMERVFDVRAAADSGAARMICR
ncbi:MAG: DUF3473 domain-containing protein [Gammaproteobacteria bacterium]|nr:DUF3473 domain-containing protein [Gammaproteobacteria bacterium]